MDRGNFLGEKIFKVISLRAFGFAFRDAGINSRRFCGKKLTKNTEEWEAVAHTSQVPPFFLEYFIIFFDFSSSFLLNFFGENVMVNMPNQKVLEKKIIRILSHTDIPAVSLKPSNKLLKISTTPI